MNIYDPSQTSGSVVLPHLFPQHIKHAISNAEPLTIASTFGVIIKQEIRYDICKLAYYVLQIKKDVTLCNHYPEPVLLFNFVLASPFVTDKTSTPPPSFRKDQFQFQRSAGGSMETFYQRGEYRFVQLEFTTSSARKLLAGTPFLYDSKAWEEDPFMFKGLSLNINMKACLLIDKILHNEWEEPIALIGIEAAVKDLLHTSISTFRQYEEQEYQQHIQGDALFKDIREFIITRTDETIKIPELCRRFGISRTRLYEIFLVSGKIGVRSFIVVQKIEKAKLLLQNNISLGEIAIQLGFQDKSNFIRTFKKWVGTTPHRFKEGCRRTN